MSNPSLIYNQGIAPVRENRYNNLKENRKDISNESQARRVLGENTKEYKEIYGERNNPERGRGRSLENSERMPDGGDEQNRRINGDNAPNATDSPKGREFQSEKIEEQAKKPTEGFYARLIKEDNIPDKKIDDKISPDSRKTQEGYGNRVSFKNGNKKGTIIGSVPTGEDYSGKKRFKYEVRWDDGTVERLSDENVDIETPDSGEDFDLGRFINNIKDRMDIANSRKQGITVGELIEKNKFLKPIEDALSDISDYTISPMPDNVKNPRRRATHLSKSKMIWLNMDVLRNDPRGFVVSFMHEVQHAKQMKKYKELSSKGKLTPEEKRFVDNYKELKKVNKIRLEYYNKHKKFLNDVFDRLDEFNQTEAQEYNNSLTPMQREILKTYDKLYSDYYNTPFEVEARQAGEFYARRVEREGYTLGNQGRIEEEGYTLGNQGRYTDRSVGYRPRMQASSKSNERTSSGRPRENEERSGKTPQDGSGIEFDIDNVDKIVKKVKKKDNTFVHVASKILTPISTRLEDINPVLKHALRKFELDSALAENRSAETIKPFVDKLDKIEKVRTGKTLTTKTIYKKVGASAENQKRLTTKETPEVSPDNSIITNNEGIFNTETKRFI